MRKDNSILRIVPNIYSQKLDASKDFYTKFLGLDLVMDLGWVLTFASQKNPTAQINVIENKERLNNDSVFLSIEILDVDVLYEQAKLMKIPIVYSLKNEKWGVRRFFVKDPNGATINILSHETKVK